MYRFKEREPIRITEIINEEKLLFMALNVCNSEYDEEVRGYAFDIIIWYLLKKKQENNESFTEEELMEEGNSLVLSAVLEGMSKKGLLDVEFDEDLQEPVYKLTSLGKSVADVVRSKKSED